MQSVKWNGKFEMEWKINGGIKWNHKRKQKRMKSPPHHLSHSFPSLMEFGSDLVR